jgi:1,3-beta-glucanosyltransferase GAS1
MQEYIQCLYSLLFYSFRYLFAHQTFSYNSIDLTLPVNGSIDRDSPSWTTNLLDLYIGTIDAFSAYDNVLAYNIGNEVIIAPNGTDAAAFVKAAARDTKAYL